MPQEAIIGITFVVAAAGVILLLSRVAGGKEELEHLLTGDILNVTGARSGSAASSSPLLAAFYAAFHQQFALISSDADERLPHRESGFASGIFCSTRRSRSSS